MMRRLFSMIAAVALAACCFQAPAEAQLDIQMVSGTVDAAFTSATTVEGSIAGDLEGTIAVDLDADTTVIETSGGTITTTDEVVIIPVGNMALWFGRHVIDEATGDFEGAVGGIATLGTVGPNGEVMLHYAGFLAFLD